MARPSDHAAAGAGSGVQGVLHADGAAGDELRGEARAVSHGDGGDALFGHVRGAFTGQRLCGHAWPGNVRELKEVVEWAAALADGTGELSDEAVNMAMAYRMSDESAAEPLLADRGVLRQLLERHAWKTDSVARELGVHRATVYRHMKRLRVKTPADIRVDSHDVARMNANGRDSHRGCAEPSTGSAVI